MTTKRIIDLIEDDVIDLEGVDESEDNQQTWLDELATVESVSTLENPSGGWLDGWLRTSEAEGKAIIYLLDAASPAIVPLDAVVEVDES